MPGTLPRCRVRRAKAAAACTVVQLITFDRYVWLQCAYPEKTPMSNRNAMTLVSLSGCIFISKPKTEAMQAVKHISNAGRYLLPTTTPQMLAPTMLATKK